jgi:hypothetical protein
VFTWSAVRGFSFGWTGEGGGGLLLVGLPYGVTDR